MNSTKKLFLAAGLLLQLSGSLQAGWPEAFAAFGGAQNVYDARGSMGWNAAKKIAMDNGNSPELLAIGLYMSDGNPATNAPKFKGAAPQEAMLTALQDALNVVQPSPIPVDSAVKQQQANNASSSSSWGWFSGGSSAQAAPQPKTQADVDNAVNAVKRADAAQVAQTNQLLSAIAGSNADAAARYKAYVDYVFDGLAQAVASIEDAQLQAQVVQYIQGKRGGSGNRYNSRTLGRMHSKKHKNKNS